MSRPFLHHLDPWAEEHEIGMRDDHIQEMLREIAIEDIRQRWQGIKALWAKPILTEVRHDGVELFERNREEEWTRCRAIRCTIGLIFNLPSWAPTYESLTLASYWDSRETYDGYEVMIVGLRGWFGASWCIDGECLM